jgi:type VI secretion system Hcp family effector
MLRCLPAVLFITTAHPVLATYSAWMEVPGVPGDSTDTGHVNWINVNGFEIAGTLSKVGGFSIRKEADRSSPHLFQFSASGEVKPTVTIDFRKPSAGSSGIEYLRLELSDVVFTGYSTISLENAAVPTETVSLKFEKIIYIYQDGADAEDAFHYDNATSSGGLGADPENPDGDGDGMSDAWEAANGLSVGPNDANLDLDGDGLSNISEFQLGTNPRSGASFFKATLVANAISPGNHQITWNSVAGKSYIIEWSPDLVTPFIALRTVTATTTSTSETVSQSGALGFYRVRPAP